MTAFTRANQPVSNGRVRNAHQTVGGHDRTFGVGVDSAGWPTFVSRLSHDGRAGPHGI